MNGIIDHQHRRPICEIETRLTDGRSICLRTIRPSDEARIRQGIADMSDKSRYLRFFSAFREPPESIVKSLSAVDGHDHIGWGAILLDGNHFPPIAAAHAIRLDENSNKGELAIAVLDEYHGMGVARMLIAAVMIDCIAEGLSCLEMQVMYENNAAANLIIGLGAERSTGLGPVLHYSLDAQTALERLDRDRQCDGIAQVLTLLNARSR